MYECFYAKLECVQIVKDAKTAHTNEDDSPSSYGMLVYVIIAHTQMHACPHMISFSGLFTLFPGLYTHVCAHVHTVCT